jgi:hypothetical protein
MASKSLFKPFVTISLAPVITSIIIHFIYNIRFISIHIIIIIFFIKSTRHNISPTI